ncbi:Protein SMG7, partial [Mucuna pruriens]
MRWIKAGEGNDVHRLHGKLKPARNRETRYPFRTLHTTTTSTPPSFFSLLSLFLSLSLSLSLSLLTQPNPTQHQHFPPDPSFDPLSQSLVNIEEMDKVSAPSSRERAQRLYDKNIELENKRRRSAQAQVPSDSNAWQQIRENYEAIILEDHAFSEQHNIEFALWHLHYKQIEELRAYFNAALTSVSTKSSQGGSVRPDQITKIRLQFKTFLSEATGFYHDLIMKIRAKYGLPLGYFEDSENKIVMEKDGKKSFEMKKGLISCHRCLIYLGDLARYKGLYGEGDSVKREFAAASSYYLQAASIWPSSGNPHHQLAILASYSGDELAATYRYFRSLAVDSPFTTVRENLIIAFEKNCQSFSQLPGEFWDRNALAIVRIVCILVFTIYNVNKEAEGILVFVEWLACYPDLAVGNDVDENQKPSWIFQGSIPLEAISKDVGCYKPNIDNIDPLKLKENNGSRTPALSDSINEPVEMNDFPPQKQSKGEESIKRSVRDSWLVTVQGIKDP